MMQKSVSLHNMSGCQKLPLIYAGIIFIVFLSCAVWDRISTVIFPTEDFQGNPINKRPGSHGNSEERFTCPPQEDNDFKIPRKKEERFSEAVFFTRDRAAVLSALCLESGNFIEKLRFHALCRTFCASPVHALRATSSRPATEPPLGFPFSSPAAGTASPIGVGEVAGSRDGGAHARRFQKILEAGRAGQSSSSHHYDWMAQCALVFLVCSVEEGISTDLRKTDANFRPLIPVDLVHPTSSSSSEVRATNFGHWHIDVEDNNTQPHASRQRRIKNEKILVVVVVVVNIRHANQPWCNEIRRRRFHFRIRQYFS
ncbi:unnamed protein product [Notodromas monacha]|uniref:Transmembrane protein n=1 Tax=Notodromas monacha TaxID=399045 RepID=A0A7R9C048_9CRUS|nr:unnamed protein product [Notodromas monacha]CAG0924029.1 unnamed protein product [Notodromas monacha]